MHGLKLRQLAAWLVVLSATTLTGTILSITQSGVFFPFSWTADYQKVHHAITIDAGSHGTRAHLFSWAGRVENPEYPLLSPVTIPRHVGVIAPSNVTGISDYINEPSRAGEAVLQPLIQGLITRLIELGVSPTEFADIRIYLKATAGMRNTDVDARDALMNSLRAWLKNKANSPFAFKSGWARVISGEEEGTFGWIAVNNLLGTLLSPANATVGALDLGGASAQITFMPTHTSVLEDYYELQLGPSPIRLYSHSFLGYGWDDAHQRVTTRLALERLFTAFKNDTAFQHLRMDDIDVAEEVKEGHLSQIRTPKPKAFSAYGVTTKPAFQQPTLEILKADHPCFPRGSSFKFDIPSLLYPDGRAFLDMDLRAIIAYIKAVGLDLNSPVIKKHFPPEVLEAMRNRPFVDKKAEAAVGPPPLIHVKERPFKPFAEPLPPAKVRYRVVFSGTGDFYGCQHRANQLFYQEPCFLSTCSFNGIYQPRIAESKFLALGQYSKISAALNIPSSSTPNTLARAASRLCATEWEALLAEQHRQGSTYPSGKHAMQKLCWKAVWAHAILTYGYGLDGESQSVTFWTPPDLAGDDEVDAFPGWALGSMVAEITFYPWQNARGRFEAPFWWALGACFFLTLLAIVQERRNINLRSKLSFFEIRRSDVYEEM